MKVNSARLWADFDKLGEFGREPKGGISRPAYSPMDIAARQWFAERASEAGLPVTIDALQNVIVGDPTVQPAVWAGSHLDTVPNGGMYDGAVGAIAALECLRRIREEDVQLARPVRAVAFADEEGTFHGNLGSKAIARGFSEENLDGIFNSGGQSLIKALREAGSDLSSITNVSLPDDAMHCFLELHIEQGPVLEAADTTIGIVTHIAGVNRGELRFDGRADHAGTTPMNLRKDALRGAAAFLDRMPGLPDAAGLANAVVTCGRLTLQPGAENVVPATAIANLDFRDVTPEGLDRLEEMIISEARACASLHDLKVEYRRTSRIPPVDLNGHLSDSIENAATRLGLASRRLLSGAGHDAQVMAELAPAGMIFVPSHKGRSHSPWEYTAWKDVEHGANVLLETLLEVAGVDTLMG
ncbi:Zn-dependent hydrolase [soil metagenome]